MVKARGRRVKKKDDDAVNLEAVDENNDTLTKEMDSEPKEEQVFFGLVDTNELTYFRQAEQTLNINTFSNVEERALFINSVFQEAKGKELKLVTNQIGSKLMERLIFECTLKHMHQLFNVFNGRFYELSRHKFSSHVMESFLVRCASLIEKEILSNGYDQADYEDVDEEESEGWVSMENMFLFIINDFKSHVKKMIKDKYASHVLRLALLVMTGKELPSAVESNSILRSKKSKIARKTIDLKDSEDHKRKFQVPTSFKDELSELLKTVTKNETTEKIRELAIDSVASPVIQLLIQLEGIVDKDRTIWRMIFNGDDENADPKDREKEGAYVEFLLSNNVGSHFLQNAIANQKTKSVERIYSSYMRDRIEKLARRETTGVYVVEAMMGKLKSKQQQEILDKLIPIMNELMINNIDLGSKVIDCSINNNDYRKVEIVQKLLEFFSKGSKEFDLFENILMLSVSTLHSFKDDWPTAEERRRSLLFEKLIEYDTGKILHIAVQNLLDLDDLTLIKFCKHGVFSHIVESILKMRDHLSIPERKNILNKLLGQGSNNLVELSCHSTGSHIVDKFWMFTFKLNMIKERIARALLENKDTIKDTIYGRMVWKNWNMELYCRKFNDWKWNIKEEEKVWEEEKKLKEAAEAEKLEESSNVRVKDAKRIHQGDDEKSNKRRRGRGRK
ncbi:hypothetical protein CANINC_000852 [Pichia inconspicua]|uniref:Nucleolar protein 9 n=1 Tax=Pichia inconspicua TaxID=52247 RepID=A0A4T0X500_9ASCO|nr:hypothetical protein CANINC_000852 [[Candida] inconspicua]